MRTQRLGKLLGATLLCLFWSSALHAQTHPCDVATPTSGSGVAGATEQVQFCHDGKDSTGTVTITPTSFRLYDNNVGAPVAMTKGTTSATSGKTVYTGTYTVPAVGAHALQVSALVGAAESLKSTTFTLTSVAAVPSAPTSLQVQ